MLEKLFFMTSMSMALFYHANCIISVIIPSLYIGNIFCKYYELIKK